jgi:hypothetical protein
VVQHFRRSVARPSAEITEVWGAIRRGSWEEKPSATRDLPSVPRLLAASRFEVVQDGLDRGLQGCEIVGHDHPDARGPDLGIVVPKDIAETGDCPPGDAFVLGLEFRRNGTWRAAWALRAMLRSIISRNPSSANLEACIGNRRVSVELAT